MLDFETFIKAYQEASPELKAFIDSDQIGDFCIKLLENSGFEHQKKSLILLLSSYFLSNFSESNLIDGLAKTGLSNDFIITNLDRIKEFIKKDINTLNSNAIENEIAETEAVLNAIKLNDSLSEPTYTSTQAAILEESRKLQNQNNSSNPDRWETGQ